MDLRTGIEWRHHVHERALQRAVRDAARRAGIPKPVGCHTFRYSFATHLLEDAYDIRTVQELLDVRTTMICTHVLNRKDHSMKTRLVRIGNSRGVTTAKAAHYTSRLDR